MDAHDYDEDETPPLLIDSDGDISDDEDAVSPTRVPPRPRKSVPVASDAGDIGATPPAQRERPTVSSTVPQWQKPPPRDISLLPREPKMKSKQPSREDGKCGEEVDVPPDMVPVLITNADGTITQEVWAFIDRGCARTMVSHKLAKFLQTEYGPTGDVNLGFSASFPPVAVERLLKPLHLYIGTQTRMIQPEVTDLCKYDLMLGRNITNDLGMSLGPIPVLFPSEYDKPPEDDDEYINLDNPIERLRDSIILPAAEEKLRSQLRADAEIWLEQHILNVPENSFIKTTAAKLAVLHKPNTKPAYVHQYPIKPQYVPYVTDQVLLWHGVGKCIVFDTKRHGPFPLYNMPLTVVVTRDNTGKITKIRICVDAHARALNVDLLNDQYPLPKINDIYRRLSCHRFIAEFDLTSAFLQFPVEADSEHKLAFTWNGITYVFVGAIFGVKHVSAHVQRVLTGIFQDMPFVLIYVDNMIVYSNTIEEHRMHIKCVIARCTELNIRLSPEKCQIACTEIITLGNLLTTKGVRADPRKVNAIMSFPTPVDADSLARFLGMAGYLRDYVRYFADISAPLSALKPDYTLMGKDKKKRIPFVWTEECDKAFNTLKYAIAHCPAMNFIDFNRRFFVAVDSSRYGIGAVLFQPRHEHDLPNTDNIVSLASRTLRDYEKNYEVYKLELNAIIFALKEFDDALHGNTFTLLTDHHALIYLHTQKELNRTLNQWYHHINTYDFEIYHIPGHINCLADLLSRMYQHKGPWGIARATTALASDTTTLGTREVADAVADNSLPARMVNQVVRLTKGDLFERLTAGDRRFAAAVIRVKKVQPGVLAQGAQKVLTTLHVHFDPSLPQEDDTFDPTTVDDDFSSLTLTRHPTPVQPVTAAEKLQIVQDVHTVSFMGQKKTIASLHAKGYRWPGMNELVKQVCADSVPCQKWTPSRPIRQLHALGSLRRNIPWSQLQIDISTHWPSSMGYNYILVVIDVFTSFCLLRALINRTAHVVAEALWLIFADFGPPQVVQTDQDQSFMAAVFEDMLASHCTEHRTVTAYTPVLNSCVERHIRTVGEALHKLMQHTGKQWPPLVPCIQLGLNNQILSADKNRTPFAMLLNRELNVWQSYVGTAPMGLTTPHDLEQWRMRQGFLYEKVFPVFANSRAEQVNARAILFEKTHPPSHGDLPVGAMVMVRPAVKGSKMDQLFEGAVHRVIYKTPLGAYVLQDASLSVTPPISRERLKAVPYPRERAEERHVVKKVHSHERGDDGTMLYLVEWRNEAEQTWVPQTHFDTPRMINQYWKSKGLAPPADQQEAHVLPPTLATHARPLSKTKPVQRAAPAAVITMAAVTAPAAPTPPPVLAHAIVVNPRPLTRVKYAVPAVVVPAPVLAAVPAPLLPDAAILAAPIVAPMPAQQHASGRAIPRPVTRRAISTPASARSAASVPVRAAQAVSNVVRRSTRSISPPQKSDHTYRR